MPDVLVIGAGLAGMRAALEVARAGVEVESGVTLANTSGVVAGAVGAP
jgi:succinate dehydrogenase/fumarate reductase flavoprotein subunit